MKKIKKNSKFQKSPKSFPSVQTCFGAIFSKKNLPSVPWRVESSNIFKKRSKLFQISKHAKKSFPKCPNVFWTCFGALFLKVYLPSVSCGAFQIFWTESYEFRFPNLKIWVQFSGLKNKSSIFGHKTQQTSFLHSRHCQYTQFQFRFSGLKILNSDSRTRKWVKFSGLKFWGRDVEKIEEKNQKNFKVPKMSKIVPKCPNVIWGNFFKKRVLPSVPCRVESSNNFKIDQNFSNFQTCQKIVSKMSKRVLNTLWVNIFENLFAQCSLQGISDFLDWKLWVQLLEIKKYEFKFPTQYSTVIFLH